MAYDWLKDIEDHYDIVVIGSGLAGLTSANVLAKCGHKVLLLEHHYQLGGLATWFTRKGGHMFDISLHGFPVWMIKSARKYWSQEIADAIVQIKGIRFINPQFQIDTTFDREDFTRILIEKFKISAKTVERFFTDLRAMNFYDNNPETTGEMFERYFPGRDDVQRLLMEPIAYANGSTLEDPAITFGIVFSNFMSKGVYTFQGGTDTLIKKMALELKANGAEVRKHVTVEKIVTKECNGRCVATGLVANDRLIRCDAIVSNANLKNTILRLAGEENFSPDFVAQTKEVRINTSSCQVYLGIRKGETLPHIGDLVFASEESKFASEKLVGKHTTSRAFSVYYPDTRPGSNRYTVVVSVNAKYTDWETMSDEIYQQEKMCLIEESITALEKLIPDIRAKIDWSEASTPCTVEHYTKHWSGTSFGTKFEGLKVSMELPQQLPGLYHTGSVGIIMSGWLGTINYGVIVANQVDKFLATKRRGSLASSPLS